MSFVKSPVTSALLSLVNDWNLSNSEFFLSNTIGNIVSGNITKLLDLLSWSIWLYLAIIFEWLIFSYASLGYMFGWYMVIAMLFDWLMFSSFKLTGWLKKYTKREIRVRNKPRPGNQWWNTDIKDDLKDCHCLVTNLSMAAIDAVLNKVPAITHNMNVASPVSGRDLAKIEKPLKPGRETIREWLQFVVENQFTMAEINNGTAYKTLMEQQVW